MAFNWTCPYCQRDQVITQRNFSSQKFAFQCVPSSIGHIGLRGTAIVCANSDCLKPTISVNIVQGYVVSGGNVYCNDEARTLLTKQIVPEDDAKPQPDYIPQPIVDDYIEACRIKNLSPKASATLSRRCIQGMIRDFTGIKERTLFQEIEKLKSLADKDEEPKGVSLDSIEALHHIRSMGNIGAHMEKDINLIVSVEPDESKLLIELIEDLFDEWYISRHKRQERFSKIKTVVETKEKQRKLPPPTE